MAQQIGIDGALLDAQAETRGEDIFKLHPEEFGVHFFGFHDLIQRWNGYAAAAEAVASVLSVLHLFFSFDCRLLSDSSCTGTNQKEKKQHWECRGRKRGERRTDADKVQDGCVKKRKSPEQSRGVVSYNLIVPDP